jgi:hypothetical protein
MKTKNFTLIGLGCLLGMTAGVSYAQSVADVARAERAKKSSSSEHVKVYTNDNIPHVTTLQPTAEAAPGPTSAESTAKTPEANPAPAASGASEASKAPETEKKAEDKVKTKEYWQGKFEAAKAALDRAEEEQRLSEDELNLAQMNQARELDPDKQPALNRDVTSKQAAADAKRAAAEKAKLALDDLKKEFEASGAPKEWLPAEDKQ